MGQGSVVWGLLTSFSPSWDHMFSYISFSSLVYSILLYAFADRFFCLLISINVAENGCSIPVLWSFSSKAIILKESSFCFS